MLLKGIKDLTFEVSYLSIHLFLLLSYKGPNIDDVHTERGWGGPESCHVFIDCWFQTRNLLFIFMDGVGGWGGLWKS